MSSILTDIKSLLGIGEETHFDNEIKIHINSAIMNLAQIGIGPSEGFSITGYTETWVDLIGYRKDIDAVKTYLYLKTKIIFDPPSSSIVMDSIDKQTTQIEWRLNTQVEKYVPKVVVNDEDS